MASTSTLLVAASNLVNGAGLAPNSATVTLCETITSDSLVVAYAALQPGSDNGDVLESNSLSAADLGLPIFVSNANIVASGIASQISTVFPDVITFSSILLSLDSFVLYSDKTYKSIENVSSTSFDNLGINVNSHQSAITNGITTMFGGGATNAAQIKTNMNAIGSALGNFGTLYDSANLDKLGDPATFIKHLNSAGHNLSLPKGWETLSATELRNHLNGLSGTIVGRVAELSKFTPPAGQTIYNLGDYLDLSKVVPPDVLALIPGKDFAGLSNMFVNLGGRFASFADVAAMLQGIEVPSLTHLGAYSVPATSEDIDNLKSKIGSGSGDVSNPTIMDVLGSVAGLHVDQLTTVASALSSIATNSTTTTLVTSLSDLATACEGGDSETIATSFATAQAAADAFNDDPEVVALSSASDALTAIESHVAAETANIESAGVNISAAQGSGVAGVLALVNNLHDYGVDRNKLKYNQLFAGLVESNVGGDAILASLAEGKNINLQAQYSVPIGTKLSQ